MGHIKEKNSNLENEIKDGECVVRKLEIEISDLTHKIQGLEKDLNVAKQGAENEHDQSKQV
jgi:predicted  nucleic acid-binding Zn-ribbon protein